MDKKEILLTILRDGYILVFNQDKLDVVKTAQALQQAGISNMELTCRVSQPLAKLKQLRQELPDFVVGAASLLDYPAREIYNARHAADPVPSVTEVVEAGAHYLVSAVNFQPQTYQQFAGQCPMIPGCGTASEIAQQYSLGASLCKVFPAKELGGPAFVKAIDPALHKFISLVPTGGTNLDNIPDYIAAGVMVLGGSFSMIDKAAMAAALDKQDYSGLVEQLKAIKARIDECRRRQWPDLDFATASLDDIIGITGRNFNL